MKFTDKEIQECESAMSKPAPIRALELIASGEALVSLSKDGRVVYIETYRGKRISDPDFPERKMALSGAWPLYRAGMIDQYGCVTKAGHNLINQQGKQND